MNTPKSDNNSFLVNARDIFAQVIDMEESADLKRHIEKACAGNQKLLAEVNALLKAHRDAGGFLDQTGRSPKFTISPDVGEQPGDQVGPYTVVRKLGEGGFGDVFLAEQKSPVERQVALKVIKPGLETRKVIARFEAERQTLALMEHAQIATIFEAGTTDRGRPFFAMEFVDGSPLTDYCDAHKLPIAERLELFLSVCRAVQHAHQKGIIHRDLKPSNILVAEENEQPIVKVIDFGIAKATNRQLIETSVATLSGQMIGTPQYMSPEQAVSGEIDVDTRSDIYSLGVILYELLVGTTPLTKDRVQATPPIDLSHLIRSGEVERPSKRLDETVSELERILAHRGTERSRLRATLRRDLDWIVLKSLEKERVRRYHTVDALARDLTRFLNDQPVEARPPSMTYRFQKLAGRYKVALVTGTLFVLLIVTAAIVSTLLAVRALDAERLASRRLSEVEAANATARAERDRAIEAGQIAAREAANAKAVSDFVSFDLLASTAPSAYPNRNITMREILDIAAVRVASRFDDQPQLEATLRWIIGNAYIRLGAYKRAETQLKIARNLETKRLGARSKDVLGIQNSLADCYIELSRFAEAEELLTKTLSLQRQSLNPASPALLESRMYLAKLYLHQRRFDEAQALIREFRKQVGNSGDPTDRHSLMTFNHLAGLYYLQKRNAQAESILRELFEKLRSRFGRQDPDTLAVGANLAEALGAQMKSAEALELASETYQLQRKVLGEEHPYTIKCRFTLAKIFAQQQNFKEADRHLAAVIAASQRALGRFHPDTIRYQHIYAALLARRQKFADALPHCQAAARAAPNVYGESHRVTLESRLVLARILSGLGRRKQAEQVWRSLQQQAPRALGKNHPLTQSVAQEWSEFRRRRKKSP